MFLEDEQTYKSSLYVYYLVGVVCLGSFFTGYQMGVSNSSQRALRVIFAIEDEEKAEFDGLVTSLIPLGGIIGAFISNQFLKRHSRKNSLLLTDCVGLFGSLLSMCIVSKYLFFLGRLICGIGCGLNSALVSLYVMEVAPIQIRQQVSTLPSFSQHLGTLAAYSSGLLFRNLTYSSFSISAIYGTSIIICLARLFFLKYFHKADSPFFFMERGEISKAKEELEHIYKEEYIEQVYHDYHQSYIEQQKNQLKLYSIFAPSNRKRIIIAISQMFFLHFVGVSAVLYYSTKIFKAATNQNEKLSYYSTVINGVVLIICAFSSGFLSQSYGRKKMLSIGMTGQVVITLSLSLLSFFDVNDGKDQTPKWLQFLLIVNVIAARSYVAMTFEPNAIAYNSDICCQRGVSVAFMSYWLFSGTIGLLFPIALENIGLSATFFFFCLISIAGTFFVEKYVKETQGLTRTEIQFLYDPEYEDQVDKKIYRQNSMKKSIIPEYEQKRYSSSYTTFKDQEMMSIKKPFL